MATMTQDTASAADFVRHFAQYRDAASRFPVYITHHGRPTHVLVHVQAFEKLGHGPARSGDAAAQADDDILFSLADWIDEALVICDHDLRIEFANRVAHAVTRKTASALIGQPLTEALPEVAGTLIEVHARRTTIGAEPSGADLPSPFRSGAWMRFQSFPIADRVALKFRDITDDVQQHRLADVKRAILEGMSVHGGIGYVRVSLRGTIDRVDQPFCRMLDLPEDRLIGVPLCDLIGRAGRAAFREALEQALRSQASARLETQVLSNRGDLVEVRLSIVPLYGAYGAEGAVVLLTPKSEEQDPLM